LVADSARSATPVGPPAEAELVMLCVRVPPSLRRRLKLVAVQSGRPIQALATEAFERVCTQYDHVDVHERLQCF
jgi:hypothetical protein